jgi:hypothetical protein
MSSVCVVSSKEGNEAKERVTTAGNKKTSNQLNGLVSIISK